PERRKPGLLVQLPPERSLERFAGLDGAPGELPLSAEPVAGRAPQQHVAAGAAAREGADDGSRRPVLWEGRHARKADGPARRRPARQYVSRGTGCRTRTTSEERPNFWGRTGRDSRGGTRALPLLSVEKVCRVPSRGRSGHRRHSAIRLRSRLETMLPPQRR